MYPSGSFDEDDDMEVGTEIVNTQNTPMQLRPATKNIWQIMQQSNAKKDGDVEIDDIPDEQYSS